MGNRLIKAEDITFVAKGSFTPLSFNPEALLRPSKLFMESEFDTQTIDIIHQNIAKYSIGGITFQTLPESLVMSSIDARNFEKLRDKIISVFEILDRTPVHIFGINHNYVFTFESREKWHELGHVLAPKAFWKDVMENPGMFSMTMENSPNPSCEKGYVRVKVEPHKDITFGISVQINSHFVIESVTQPKQSAELIKYVNESWADVAQYSKKILEKLMKFDE